MNTYIITKICDFTELHATQLPYASFTPPRTRAIGQWFLGSSDYSNKTTSPSFKLGSSDFVFDEHGGWINTHVPIFAKIHVQEFERTATCTLHWVQWLVTILVSVLTSEYM